MIAEAVEERQAATCALIALDEFLAADQVGDAARALAALDLVMAFVHRGGRHDDRAAPRLIGLSMVVVKMTAGLLSAGPRCACPGHYYAIHPAVAGTPWMQVPEHDQVALAAVVHAMNDEWPSAQALVQFHALHTGSLGMVQVLITLAELHSAAHTLGAVPDAAGTTPTRGEGR